MTVSEDARPSREVCPLFLDCTEEKMSEAQLNYRKKQADAFKAQVRATIIGRLVNRIITFLVSIQMKLLENLAKAGAAITQLDLNANDDLVSFRTTEVTTFAPVVTSTTTTTAVNGGGDQPVVSASNGGQAQYPPASAMAPAAATAPPANAVVTDPRNGRFIGHVNTDSIREFKACSV